MSVSSRRRPRHPTPRRSGGRSPAAASGRAGPPGRGRRCVPGRAGRGAAGALCAGPRARPSWAGPGGCGALAAAAPGPAPFCWASGRVGREGRRPGERGAPERPLCLPHPGGGGGCWVRAAGVCAQLGRPGTCEPSNERPGAPPARSAPTACSHLAAGAPRTCPEGGMGTFEVCTVVSVTRAWWGVGAREGLENKELPSTHRSFFLGRVLQQDCLA